MKRKKAKPVKKWASAFNCKCHGINFPRGNILTYASRLKAEERDRGDPQMRIARVLIKEI